MFSRSGIFAFVIMLLAAILLLLATYVGLLNKVPNFVITILAASLFTLYFGLRNKLTVGIFMSVAFLASRLLFYYFQIQQTWIKECVGVGSLMLAYFVGEQMSKKMNS